VARHTDELAIVCRRDPQAPALRNDTPCSKAGFCRISFGNLRRNLLANPALKAGNFRFEFGGVALQLGDISSELGRRFPQSLRLAPDFPAGKPCDLLPERGCYIRHLSFLLCWCSGNTTIMSIIARPPDYVCSDRHPERQCVEGKHQRDDVGIVARHCSASCRRRSIAEKWKIPSAAWRQLSFIEPSGE
jgi:hypothetical protein